MIGADLERELAALPLPPPWLRGDSSGAWARERHAIHRHHRQWRDGGDTWDGLYEDGEQRARALAGNLARELGATFEAAAVAAPDPAALTLWMQETSVVWIETIRLGTGMAPAGESGLEGFVEEFLGRERRRVLERLATAPPPVPAPWRRLLFAVRTALHRALFPGA